MGSQPLTTNLEVEILSNDLCLDRKINTTKSYLVREENTVCFVFVSRVNPRVANKVNTTMTGNIIKCERLKVEFTVVQASYYEGPWNSYLLVPIKCDTEF